MKVKIIFLIVFVWFGDNLFAQQSSYNNSFIKTFGGAKEECGLVAAETSDGEYIAAGYSDSFGNEGWTTYLFKLDNKGDTIWTFNYGASGTVPFHISEIDNNYLLGVNTHMEIVLLVIDSTGKLLWEKNYSGKGTSIQKTTDDGFIIAGCVQGENGEGMDLYILKITSDGEFEWAKSYGGDEDEDANDVQQTSDGGYLLFGTTRTYGAGSYDMYMIKTDSLGRAKGFGSNDKTFCVETYFEIDEP
ncbi:MAG: hypothetical protein JXA77_01880 [Bacteroidales bacterium]|nr:hypothetical protein [Bacteroidales bacterium]MBN2820839.1 hypothetical protein [Bacteroidales bacterium]